MMADAARLKNLLPRQLSFKHTVQLWTAWHGRGGDLEGREKYCQLLTLIAQKRVGNRANRIEPRAVKRRPKPYPRLTVPRANARKNIAKYGHPEKLK